MSVLDLALLLCIVGLVALSPRLLVPLIFRRGRQVEYRLARGTGTGEVLGLEGLRLRVRSLSSGRVHTVALTSVRRR